MTSQSRRLLPGSKGKPARADIWKPGEGTSGARFQAWRAKGRLWEVMVGNEPVSFGCHGMSFCHSIVRAMISSFSSSKIDPWS